MWTSKTLNKAEFRWQAPHRQLWWDWNLSTLHVRNMRLSQKTPQTNEKCSYYQIEETDVWESVKKQEAACPHSASDKAENLSWRLSVVHTQRPLSTATTWPHCTFCATEHHSCRIPHSHTHTHMHTHTVKLRPHPWCFSTHWLPICTVCFLGFLCCHISINPPLREWGN